MEFFKKHYEKILLGLVLAGLIGALVFMVLYIMADKQAMDDRAANLTHPSVKKLPDLDLGAEENIGARLQAAYVLDFETTNKLFNPMEWQKAVDGSLIKIRQGNEVGAAAVVVTNITPLYLTLSLDSVITNELGVRYAIGVEKQAEKTVSKRHKQQRFISAGDKPNDTFSLVDVKGAAENPDALILKLVDTGESASISFNKPFRRVDGYTADFRYDPERKVFHARRAGDKVTFNNTDFIVSEINQNELILSDQTNQKKTSLPFAP